MQCSSKTRSSRARRTVIGGSPDRSGKSSQAVERAIKRLGEKEATVLRTLESVEKQAQAREQILAGVERSEGEA